VILRKSLAWAGNPLAEQVHLFRVHRTNLGRRRWLERERMVALWNSASDDEKVPIGLMLFGGLRRIEVLRLRVRTINFALDSATLKVCGNGMRWRSVPVPAILWAVLRSQTPGMKPVDRIFPGNKITVDRALSAAGSRAGCFPIRPNGTPELSNHDLRRTYIRQMLGTGKVGL